MEALLSEGYLRALDMVIQLPQSLREEEKRVAMEQELEAVATAQEKSTDAKAFDGF